MKTVNALGFQDGQTRRHVDQNMLHGTQGRKTGEMWDAGELRRNSSRMEKMVGVWRLGLQCGPMWGTGTKVPQNIMRWNQRGFDGKTMGQNNGRAQAVEQSSELMNRSRDAAIQLGGIGHPRRARNEGEEKRALTPTPSINGSTSMTDRLLGWVNT